VAARTTRSHETMSASRPVTPGLYCRQFATKSASPPPARTER
jgi:hypothetical protein